MKSAKITLYKSLLTSDIDVQTFKRVDGVLSSETDQVKNALSSDSDDQLDAQILMRLIETRDAEIRARLAFCLKQDQNETISVTNEIDASDKFEYDLVVPDTCDVQKIKAIAKKMHNYIVQGSLHDWYATQNLKGNVSAEELKDMEEEIACLLRPSFVKRPLQPFGPR